MNKKLLTSIIVIILFLGALLAVNKFMSNKDRMEQSSITEQGGNNVASAQGSNVSIGSNIEIDPIEHATMVLKWGGKVIYTDPVGGESAFLGEPAPDMILLTDIHSDHLDIETLKAVSRSVTSIVAPMAVADMIPDTVAGTLYVMKNGQKTDKPGFSVEAIPMYNLPEKKDSFHTKGRGNGYVVEAGGKRVYISGDTSNIPEMQNLKNIDIAFVCMNLPYTMSVESAASAVLAFKPKQVYPYHYKGTNGLSDINKFKTLVNKGDPNIDVVLLNWYPK